MTLEKLARYLSDKDDIAVISHIAPDGDAVGTALACCRAFNKAGKRAFVALADPVPKKYMFLSGAEEVVMPDKAPFAPKCAFAVDVSEKHRMGSAQALFDSAFYTALLDHHETNRGFGETWYVDGTSSSTGELALELLKLMGCEIDREMADSLFIAISTDSGNFNYGNTNRRTFTSAAECLDYGADAEYLTKRAFRLRSLPESLLLGEALSRAKVCLGGSIAYTYVNNEMLAKTGATLEDASNIANYMNEIEGTLVGVYFEQQSDNTKISWRSGAEIDISVIARRFGGGGHHSAAGANLKMSMDEAVSVVVKAPEAEGAKQL